MEDLVIGGGTEMMSIKHKGMFPIGGLNPHLQEIHPQSHQGVARDAIATIEGISREVLDAQAAESAGPPQSPSPRAASNGASSRC